MKKLPIAIAILAAAAFAAPASADQVVYFVNGKAITVKSVEKGPKITVLEVEGGGRIGVPTEQIERIDELQPASPAAAPAPQPMAAPATIVTPQPGKAAGTQSQQAADPGGSTQAAAPMAATGPGTGGKPFPGAMPAQPIAIGGDAAAGQNAPQTTAQQAQRPAPGSLPAPGMAQKNSANGRSGWNVQRRSNQRNAGYGAKRPPVDYGQQRPGGTLPPAPGQAQPAAGAPQNPPPPPAPPVPDPTLQGDGYDPEAEDAAPPPEPDPGADQGEGDSAEPPADDSGNES